MKIFKKVVLTFFALLVLSSVGGYIYFNVKFTPPSNYLKLTKSSTTIPITWISDKSSSIAALLLPIKFEGIPNKFYMQFDLGAPSTLFYKTSLKSIHAKYPNQVSKTDSATLSVNQSFFLGEMKISSETFRVFDRGNPIDWNDNEAINVIGTIGADLIEKKITMIDFKNDLCYFGETMPKLGYRPKLYDFTFSKRKVLFPVILNGKACKLLYDTGTSGFELITDKSTWQKMTKKGAIPTSYDVNSWGNTLTTYNIKSDRVIDFGMIAIKLDQVTYIEGATFAQNILMRLTGMGGMIGNKLFIDKILILDCKNEKYVVLN